MTPLEISILLHYRGSASDFRDGDFSAPAVRAAIDAFKGALGLLAPSKLQGVNYALTERGEAFVDALCNTPLPECVWIIPRRARTLHEAADLLEKGDG